MKAIRKELPALIITLHKLYDDSGDAEAYGLALALSAYSGVATINLLSVVLDLLAKLNCLMQRKATDLSRLPIILKSIVSELKHLKDAGAEWCSLVETSIAMLATDQGITMRMSVYREAVAIPYMDALVSNISRFSDSAVNLLVSSSIFNPVLFPTDEAALPAFGNNELKVCLIFMGRKLKQS